LRAEDRVDAFDAAGKFMSSSLPIVRQISWLATLPQLAALFAAMGVGAVIDQRNGVLLGTVAYLAYSIGSRQLIARDHRAGIMLFKQQRFAEAIPKFADSLAFFDRHPWIDRLRSITMMSASAVSYREMALANIAFCYGQLGDGEQSRAYYRQCLERFPHSGLATAALRMLDSVTTPAGG
jgi:tetratricopeptide (TPR) repeat protein